jgi:hypothetical protein
MNHYFIFSAGFHSSQELVVTIANIIKCTFLHSYSFAKVGHKDVVVMLVLNLITVRWVSPVCHPINRKPGGLVKLAGHILAELLSLVLGANVKSAYLPVLIHSNVVILECFSKDIYWQVENSFIGINKVHLLSQRWSPSLVQIIPRPFVCLSGPRIPHFQQLPLLSVGFSQFKGIKNCIGMSVIKSMDSILASATHHPLSFVSIMDYIE